MRRQTRRSGTTRRDGTPTALLGALVELRANCVAAEREFAALIAAVRPAHRASARNLVHYVALRRHDLRELQDELTRLGLSSLGRCEPHVVATLDAVITVVRRLAGEPAEDLPVVERPDVLLGRNADRLLGVLPRGGTVRVMVTLPTNAARDPGLVGDLVAGGMDVARINCAHDTPAAWRAMAANVRATATAAGRPVRIAADLAGPKLRTAPLGPGLPVLRVAPTRDERGRVETPAQLFLCASLDVDPPADAVVVPVTEETWLRSCHPGDVIWLRDARDASRRFTVVSTGDDGIVVTTRRTVYLETGLVLERRTPRGRAATTVGPLPVREPTVVVHVGDELLLTAEAPASDAVPGRPVRVGCTLPEAVEHAAPGHRVWFDDGKVGAVVVARRADGVLLRVTHARAGGSRLRGGKGINLPDTDLPIKGLTEKDLEDLAQLVDVIDIVDVSFVRSPDDVALVQHRLRELGGERLGLVLKIETISGFRHLPEILLTAMRSDRVGVMIARGDLAVEAGFERLAEVQEEILWLCEAGHVPVVWATQVLDQLARTGRPSRAEISDAALGGRAECIMLNKGPHVVAAMAALQDIHGRMREHQHKKRSLLRRLRAWDAEPASVEGPPGEPAANVR